jgi:anaerobic magnesium-protoporphyrin IX monomethyl ester cyclase
MKILFLTPPIWDQSLPHKAIRPIAPALLNAGFEKLGHDSVFIDSNALQWNWEKIGNCIKEMNPDIIAFTALYNNRFASKNMVGFIKVNFPSKKIISGGPYATTNPEDLLQWGVDSVCVGEGDLVLKEVIGGKGIVQGKKVEDLDSLPLPIYETCFPEEYMYEGAYPRFEHPEGWLLITRGCPHYCAFCSNPLFSGQKTRFMGSGRIYEELNLLKSRGIKHVYLYSDELVGSNIACDKKLEEICEKISPLGLTYKTQGRCSKKITLGTLQGMVAAGFKSVGWGVESFSEKVLKEMHKATDLEDIYSTLRLSKRAGLFNWLFIMVGGFNEEVEDFEATKKHLQAVKREGLIDGAQISIMTLEPGAPCWQKALAEGWIQDKHFHTSHFEPTLQVPWATKEELQRRQNELWKVIYG